MNNKEFQNIDINELEIFDNINLTTLPDSFWDTPGKIITDEEYLSKPTFEVIDVDLGEKIARKLFATLSQNRTGIALTANQIGIPYSVFVVKVIKPLVFINPTITMFSQYQVTYKEQCLSLPGKKCKIKRHINLHIKSLNHPEELFFGIPEHLSSRISKKEFDKILLEVVAIQHEFDHTQGILITDNDSTKIPIKNEKQFGRNDIVEIILPSNSEQTEQTKKIKYKKFPEYQKLGWVIN